MLKDEDITFVIQGPYIKTGRASTNACIESIRLYFPNSKIIVSTWRNSGANDNLKEQRVHLVESDDPGATLVRREGTFRNNVNRQIISTLNGLKAVSTPYAVKLRPEIRIKGRGFVSVGHEFSVRSEHCPVFKERIVCCQYYFRNPYIYQAPFHPSDIFMFGKTEDLLNLWDIPLTQEPEFSRWFEQRPRPKPDYHRKNLFKCSPEQYIWTSCLKKNSYSVELTAPTSADKKLFKESNQLIINNFYFDSPKRLELDWPGRLKSSFPCAVLNRSDFIYFYKRDCLKTDVTLEKIKYLMRHPFRLACFYVHRAALAIWMLIQFVGDRAAYRSKLKKL